MLQAEPEACARAELGHHLSVFSHPYCDGHRGIARFLMTTLLASGGYPWHVIQISRPDAYMQALESASAKGRTAPPAEFIAQEVQDWSPKRETAARPGRCSPGSLQ